MRRATIRPYRPYARISFWFSVSRIYDLVLTKNFSEDEYQNHADIQSWLLGCSTNSGITNNTNSEAKIMIKRSP
jgi:hypothetical protein